MDKRVIEDGECSRLCCWFRRCLGPEETGVCPERFTDDPIVFIGPTPVSFMVHMFLNQAAPLQEQRQELRTSRKARQGLADQLDRFCRQNYIPTKVARQLAKEMLEFRRW